MKNCLRVPRILLPREGFERFAVPGGRASFDEAFFKRAEQTVKEEPSALRFLLPEGTRGEKAEKRINEIRENMYRALEEDRIEKLVRGCVLTERTTDEGVRRGILISIDLEAYSFTEGETSSIRAAQKINPLSLPPHVSLRKNTPLEFPHAVLLYKDKKDRIMRALKKEDLEELYDFELMEQGGHLRGYFLSEDLSWAVAETLHERGEPFLAVAEGEISVAAAKAYWEELKPTLTAEEMLFHPARFMLAELENIYDRAVFFHPIHRILQHVDPDVAIDFITSSVRCKQEGVLLTPAVPAGRDGVRRVDSILGEYTRTKGGILRYVRDKEELLSLLSDGESVGIAIKPPEKDDFFDDLKGGRLFPEKSFSIGGEREGRYCLEGREICYD